MKKQPTREKLLDITFDEVYIHGYAATSVDTILKKAGIPKGSMYHHFKGKKALVKAMIEERLFHKMDQFFLFEKGEGMSVLQSIRNTYASMAKNRPLIKYGCPLYRLMVELSPVDEEFDALLLGKARELEARLASLLGQGIEEGEFADDVDAVVFARYMLSATWGVLSLSPTLSTPKNFIAQTRFILEQLENFQNS